MSAPRTTHFSAVFRILWYLKGTLFHGLHFSSESSLALHAFCDADWAGDPTDRRSTTGYCFFLGTSLISWRSKKQTVVSRSSTEAEYRALAYATSELLWIRWLLQDMGVSQSTSTPIYCDNQSAIQIAHNDVFHERTKHIEIDYHLVRHHLQHGILCLLSVASADQIHQIASAWTIWFFGFQTQLGFYTPNLSLRGMLIYHYIFCIHERIFCIHVLYLCIHYFDSVMSCK
ncbi:hypothetical protein CFOL_v3_33486 [Cephalotus follicularis]|uniref:RVT_2 domain-containing protein n=1 Tax=Cephalotus follicularis TaxID=3775 RepID=A0A1Q3DC66_CEPFO|nr:hypothetical protein CFOL_v3_33486 [Cephalotus follicularis]